MVYAGFWRRFFAIIIDGILITIVSSAIHYALYGTASSAVVTENFSYKDGGFAHASTSYGYMYGINDWIGGLITWLYFTMLESSSCQATIGKKLLGIKVTDMDGNRIGLGRANGRFWSKILSAIILYIGFIMAAFTEKKQALHDIIAKTLVIRK
jgi:uncharacterized RDD family membrane protein YckC